MTLTLDGQRIADALPSGPTLQAILDDVRTQPDMAGRLIISVRWNGQTLGDEELGTRLAEPITTTDQIDLETCDAAELVAQAFRGLAEEFATHAAELPTLAIQLSTGGLGDAMPGMSTFVQLWQMTQRVFTHCSALLNEDLAHWTVGGQAVQAALQGLVTQLNELRSALENGDAVALADLVQYEFPPVLTNWQELLNAIATRVEQSA